MGRVRSLTRMSIEEIEDKAFEGCIMRFVENRNFGAVHALLNDYGLVLEMREKDNA